MRIPAIPVTLAAGLLFLAVPPVRAQDDKDAIIQQLKATIERQQKELDLVKKVVKEREETIIALQGRVKESRLQAATLDELVKATQTRLEAVLDQLRDANKKIARLEAEKQPGANVPNPPPDKVEGKVEKLKGDLIVINIGADSGLKKDHTLEVFRLEPQPLYVGMLRIVEVTEKSSVGRMVAPANAKNRPVAKEGDRVASSLTR
jgi:hypothetical protein